MVEHPPSQTRPRSPKAARPVRVLSVTSGKGGVGKTNIVANLAVTLGRAGYKVLIWDADLGLANIDVILGLKPDYNIHHLLTGEKTLAEILVNGPEGVRVMPASSGVQELSRLGEAQKMRLLTELDDFDDDLDFLLIDTSAGISDNVMYFNLAAQERIVVVTPEPTSITDAYALIKVMVTRFGQKRFGILINMVAGPKEAKNVFTLLTSVADKHLGSVAFDYLGFIPRDERLLQSVRMQKPVVLAFPESDVSRKFQELANLISRPKEGPRVDGNLMFFLKRVLKIEHEQRRA
jgi:flagellar biosynthesis protein FlhG